MSKIYININEVECVGNQGETILKIANRYNIEIPTMCYHEKVEKYGACGLCVVEVDGNSKLQRACSIEATNNMIIKTNTKKVIESRKTALELLLSDHSGDCYAPCKRACPGNTDCQGYVGLVANKEYEKALELLKEDLPFPSSIGRICPHPCEDECRRKYIDEPISIANIKSFIGDINMSKKDIFIPRKDKNTRKNIGIIGGGPAGLTVAYYLLSKGHNITIYDKMPEMGGMLRYGIPEYRLPKKILDEEINIIKKLGAKFINNIKIGEDISLRYLREKYDAVFLGIGTWKSSSLKLKKNISGVIGGIDYLRKISLGEKIYSGEKIAVVGGGNTAMDACRTAIRLGAKEVNLIYRRSLEDMPAEEIEIIEAQEENIKFKLLSSPVEIIEDGGRIKSIKLEKMSLGKPDKSGRRSPEKTGEFEILETDLLIEAIGQYVDNIGFEDILLNSSGNIIVDNKSFRTNIDNIFAGGDCINEGADIAIKAIGDGKKAADIIDGYLRGEEVLYKPIYSVVKDDELTDEMFIDWDKRNRVDMPQKNINERIDNFDEINFGYSENMAVEEASRCLSCGCGDVFKCKLFKYSNEYDVQPEIYKGYKHNRKIEDNHPFIKIDNDKCILCGLCIRVCNEVMDNEALGLVDRGFDTVVCPALKKPLIETSCISCGQCITTCPTGALQERLLINHSVPIKSKEILTICSYCSLGCNMNLEMMGSSYYKNTPDENNHINKGNACVYGRFSYDLVSDKDRIYTPKIKKNNKFIDIDWDEALKYIGKKLQSIYLTSGNESLAMTISDGITNEEVYLAKKYMEIFDCKNLYSLNQADSGFYSSMGIQNSTVTLNQMEMADNILLIGTDIMKDHLIAGISLNKAYKNNCNIYTFNEFNSHFDKYSKEIFREEKYLIQLEKALLDLYSEEETDSIKSLREELKTVRIDEKIEKISKIFKSSKRGVIIVDEKNLSYEGQRIISNILLLSNQINSQRKGVLNLKSQCNSQGIWDMGIRKKTDELYEKISKKIIKAIFIIGEDDKNLKLDDIEFKIGMDSFMSDTLKKCDIILPMSMYGESSGHLTNTEGRVQYSNKAKPPYSTLENWKIFNNLYKINTGKNLYKNTDDIYKDIKKNIKKYQNIKKEDNLLLNHHKIYKKNIYSHNIKNIKIFSKSTNKVNISNKVKEKIQKSMSTK